jgi:hypothetical protein
MTYMKKSLSDDVIQHSALCRCSLAAEVIVTKLEKIPERIRNERNCGYILKKGES